jgi:solute carrier family 35 protein E1
VGPRRARDDAPRARARTPRAVGGSMDDAAVVDARAGWRATLETTAAKWRPTVELGALFAGWYYFSIAFNVYQKALLKAVPMPLTATFLELAIGSALVAASWGLGAKARPDVKTSMLKPIATLGMVHMLGNALTNVSLGKVAVSFTHTVKALEPVFSVGLSAIFLGNIPSLAMCASLVPIIAGVMIASATEVSFNMAGFLSAMGSNLTFQSRNVLSKFVMTGDDMKKLDYVNLLGVLTIASTVFALPLALAFESSKMNVASIVAGGMPLAVAGKNLFMAALCFQLYQQLSFMVLSRVNPVTHSVGNSLKRVAVIAASVIIFRNPVSTTNIIGTALAIFGVILYGRVKKQKSA